MLWDVHRFTKNAHFCNLSLYASPAKIALGGRGREASHAFFMSSVGVYYENTGLEDPMFRTRKSHLPVIDMIECFQEKRAPSLNRARVLDAPPENVYRCFPNKRPPQYGAHVRTAYPPRSVLT